MTRISKDEKFMNIALIAAMRATCPRLGVGTVLVYQGHIVATGYNGSPKGMPHCTDVGCLMVDEHCLRTVHAEQNAALMLRERFPHLIAYCTHKPCLHCMKALYQVNVKELVYLYDYEDKARDEMFGDGSVNFRRYEGAILRLARRFEAVTHTEQKVEKKKYDPREPVFAIEDVIPQGFWDDEPGR